MSATRRRLAAAAVVVLAGCGDAVAPRAPALDAACPAAPASGQAAMAAFGPQASVDVAFSPDGALLAVAANGRVVTVLDAASLEVRARLVAEHPVGSVRFGPRGDRVLMLDNHGEVRAVELSTGAQLGSALLAARGDPSSSRLVASQDGQRVALLQGSLIRVATSDLDEPGKIAGAWTRAALSADGARVLAINTHTEATSAGEVWDAKGKRVSSIPGPVAAAALRPDGRAVAVARGAREVSIEDLDGGAAAAKLPAPFVVADVAWSPDGHWLAAFGGAALLVWNVATSAPVATVEHASPNGFAFQSDGAALALISGGDVVILDLPSGAQARIPVPTRAFELAWSPDGKRLAATSGSATASALVIDVATRRAREVAPGPDTPIRVAWSHDGATLAAVAGPSDGGRVRAFDGATGALRFELSDDRAKYADKISFSSDDRLLVVTSGTGFSTWDAKTGRFLAGVSVEGAADGLVVEPRPRGGVSALVADGRTHELRLVELTSGKRLATVGRFHDRPSAASFRDDGMSLAFATDRDSYVFDAPAGQAAGSDILWDKRRLGDVAVTALAWSHSGSVLYTGTAVGMVRAWDVVAMRSIIIGSHGSLVQGIAPSGDGARLASSGGDELVVWDVAKGRAEAHAVSDQDVAFAWHPREPVLAVGLAGLHVVRVADGGDVEIAAGLSSGGPAGRGASAVAAAGFFGGDHAAFSWIRVRSAADPRVPLAPAAPDRARAAILDELIRGCPAYKRFSERLLTQPEPP